MTDTFSIGQFTVDENDTVPNQRQWTLTNGQFSASGQYYCTETVTTYQDRKLKSPRFAFLKISANAHYTHLQSCTGQSTTQALQKSAILPALKKLITIYG